MESDEPVQLRVDVKKQYDEDVKYQCRTWQCLAVQRHRELLESNKEVERCIQQLNDALAKQSAIAESLKAPINEQMDIVNRLIREGGAKFGF